MSRPPAVVLYHYDGSPFATKAKNMLTIKHVPHKRVNVSMTMPRPELSEWLGITYRRIPVLAIGNDVYCDTSLIATALERHFPPSQGYGTLFPQRVGGNKSDTGLALALMMFWSDRAVFPLAAKSIPYSKFPAHFIQDRASWLGTSLDVGKLVAQQPITKSQMASHLTLLERQLFDGREWLLNTTTPGIVDISAHFVFNWVRFFRNMRDLFDASVYPQSVAWMTRMSAYLDRLHQERVAPFADINGEEAARIICSDMSKGCREFPLDHAECARLNVSLNDSVSVCPTDNGKVPTIGRLVGLDSLEVVIETRGRAGTIFCHFPRLGFTVRNTREAKL